MLIDMPEYHNMMKRLDIDIIYGGTLLTDGIEGIGDSLRKRMEFDDLPLSAAQSVFSVFVEQMNSMLAYSVENESPSGRVNGLPDSKGVFILGAKNRKYFVQSGNMMNSKDVEAVKSQIDYLNSLDKAGLRKLYVERLKGENTNPDCRGADIGFIEIARRAGSPIEYSFTPLKDNMTFFSMYVTIEQGGN